VFPYIIHIYLLYVIYVDDNNIWIVINYQGNALIDSNLIKYIKIKMTYNSLRFLIIKVVNMKQKNICKVINIIFYNFVHIIKVKTAKIILIRYRHIRFFFNYIINLRAIKYLYLQK